MLLGSIAGVTCFVCKCLCNPVVVLYVFSQWSHFMSLLVGILMMSSLARSMFAFLAILSLSKVFFKKSVKEPDRGLDATNKFRNL